MPAKSGRKISFSSSTSTKPAAAAVSTRSTKRKLKNGPTRNQPSPEKMSRTSSGAKDRRRTLTRQSADSTMDDDEDATAAGDDESGKENATVDDDDGSHHSGERRGENSLDLAGFEDELDNIWESITDNYFTSRTGATRKSRATPKKRGAKRKSAIARDDDESASDDESAPADIPVDLVGLGDWLREADEHLPQAVKNANRRREENFQRWALYLAEDFNLLFYGIGSKHRLLEAFCSSQLSTCTYLIVDGFASTITVRGVLASLVAHLELRCETMQAKSVEWAGKIVAELEEGEQHVALIIHNIDGPGMRDAISQTALSVLARSPFVHLIASIDHINALLIWDPETLSQFDFLYVNATTYRTYHAELLAGHSKLLGLCPTTVTRGHTHASMDVVWQSLTANARKLLSHIVRLTNGDAKSTVAFRDFYRAAREDFLVSSEMALRHHLLEFSEHRLIEERRSDRDGGTAVALVVDRPLLIAFLTEKGELGDDDEEP